MRKRFIWLALVVAIAAAASLVNAVASKATTVGPLGPSNSNFFDPSCNFSSTYEAGYYGYKYSGGESSYTNTPSWTTAAGENQTVQWWSVYGWLGTSGGNSNASAGPHTALWLGDTNWSTDTWTQAGVTMGYDPWGNPIDTNYPVGNWNDNTGYFPNGWGSGAPHYTPNGTLAEERYAEWYNGDEHFESIGTIGLGNGLTLKIRYDGSGQYSIVDQNGNVVGGTGGWADHINLGTSGTFYIQSNQETFSNGSASTGGVCG